MLLKLSPTLLLYVFTTAFEDAWANGPLPHDMIEQGRAQYQLLRERGSLPHYGTCWKSAVGYIEDGCKNLSEETQSDIALHLMNCFLDMSGHDTYNCVNDKKRNLRGICISSMSDRAFNVYTEFYTHTQNICWFLRGQIWHETISESTFQMGRQLEVSVQNQAALLEAQKQSAELQERILKHGKLLEGVLEDLYTSTQTHQELLRVLTASVASFQGWLLGEVSWFDSIIFYSIATTAIFIFTATKYTGGTRLPLLATLCMNLLIERTICTLLIATDDDVISDSAALSKTLYFWTWFTRYVFMGVSVALFCFYLYGYRDVNVQNHRALQVIIGQNIKIIETISNNNEGWGQRKRLSHSVVDENLSHSVINENLSGSGIGVNLDLVERLEGSVRESRRKRTPLAWGEAQNGRYNLRSKQNTPELS